jgi:hypothetical protein
LVNYSGILVKLAAPSPARQAGIDGTGMADIFISHSGRDNEVAEAIGERIQRERPSWSLFYDKDNIRAGQLVAGAPA